MKKYYNIIYHSCIKYLYLFVVIFSVLKKYQVPVPLCCYILCNEELCAFDRISTVSDMLYPGLEVRS